MGLFSKKSNGKGETIAATPLRVAIPALAPTTPTAASAAAARPPAPPPAPAQTPSPGALPNDELRRRRDQSRDLLANFGEVVSLMMRQPNGKHQSLADLEWMVIPALLSNQFAIAQQQSKDQGFVAPVAFVLWASVSPDVDKRLASSLTGPLRLSPEEWSSGDIIWLIEAFGDRQAVSAIMQGLRNARWNGRTVKMRARDAEGKPSVQALEIAAARAS